LIFLNIYLVVILKTNFEFIFTLNNLQVKLMILTNLHLNQKNYQFVLKLQLLGEVIDKLMITILMNIFLVICKRMK